MKKTFTVKGYGRNNQTTDTCRKQIANAYKRIEELNWDLENWCDTPEWKTQQKIRLFKEDVKMWEAILDWAIEKGYDKELEEA